MASNRNLPNDAEKFRADTVHLIRTLYISLETRQKDDETEETMRRLCLRIEEAFEELLSSDQEPLYHARVLYSKLRTHEKARKICILCGELVTSLIETSTDLEESPLWEDYFVDTTTTPELQYYAAVILYAVVFAANRLVECPADIWCKSKVQHLPFVEQIPMTNQPHRQILSVLFSGIYAEYANMVPGVARTATSSLRAQGVSQAIIDGHLRYVEIYLICVAEGDDLTSMKKFGLFPVSPLLAIRMIMDFLSCLEPCPHLRPDTIRMAFETNMDRVLNICIGFLDLQQNLDVAVFAFGMRLLLNMLASATFTLRFAASSGSVAKLLSVGTVTRAAPFVTSCVCALLNPHFWSPKLGDPVKALSVLEYHISVLGSIADVPFSNIAVDNLQRSDAVMYLFSYLSHRKRFDPQRTKGKENVIILCNAAQQKLVSVVCRVFFLMSESPICLQVLVKCPEFRSPNILGKFLSEGVLDGCAKELLQRLFQIENIPSSSNITNVCEISKAAVHRVPDATSGPWSNVVHRLLGIPDLGSAEARRRLDYEYIFHKMKCRGEICVPAHCGMTCSAVFVGSHHNKAVLRTDAGHLFSVMLETRKILFSSDNDWLHNNEQHMESVPWDPSKIVITSSDLNTDGTSMKSHLWHYDDFDQCSIVAEYTNFQFMLPAVLEKKLAVGHAPVWRKKHGFYFTMDMERREKLVMLGPLHDEEKHPNFPSFHPASEMVACMGTIYDIRSGDLIHKFDYFGGWGNCVENLFHANGRHILINSEVWDLRNYCLVKRADALHSARLRFNMSGDILCGKHSKRSFDQLVAYDSCHYSELCSVNFPGTISDICLDKNDYRLIVAHDYGPPLLFEIGGSELDD